MDDFREFYAARKDAVFRAVLVATGDRAGAEDAAAEAFGRAYARWSGVRVHPNPTAWVLRTAAHAPVEASLTGWLLSTRWTRA